MNLQRLRINIFALAARLPTMLPQREYLDLDVLDAVVGVRCRGDLVKQLQCVRLVLRQPLDDFQHALASGGVLGELSAQDVDQEKCAG